MSNGILRSQRKIVLETETHTLDFQDSAFILSSALRESRRSHRIRKHEEHRQDGVGTKNLECSLIAIQGVGESSWKQFISKPLSIQINVPQIIVLLVWILFLNWCFVLKLKETNKNINMWSTDISSWGQEQRRGGSRANCRSTHPLQWMELHYGVSCILYQLSGKIFLS